MLLWGRVLIHCFTLTAFSLLALYKKYIVIMRTVFDSGPVLLYLHEFWHCLPAPVGNHKQEH